jgi:hypothetical protein
MRAPGRGTLKDEINEFLKRYELGDRTSVFFLRLRDDPDRRLDKIWKKIIDDNPSIDSASERELFLKSLMDPWDSAFIADVAAKVAEERRRALQGEKPKIKKALARSFSKTSARELLALLHDASTKVQRYAEFEELYEALRQNRLYPLLNIRSDHSGSRSRTVFMRMASRLMHRTTGQWHDDWVADLAALAFPDYEGPKGEGFTVDMVISARKGTHPLP